MSIFRRISDSVERREWDHMRYLQRLTLVMSLIIFVIFVWILIGTSMGLFPQEYVQQQLLYMTSSLIYGLISGLVLSFIILLPPYIRKNWDLHEVVPNFLFYHLILTSVIMIVLFFKSISHTNTQMLLLGYITGGFIAITAYAGEVNKEHSDTE